MKKYILLLLILFTGGHTLFSQDKNVTVKLIHTTDIHGNFFPFDFINNRPGKGSLARLSAFMNGQRAVYGDNVILLDGGDLLQGQPCVYYFNFVDTASVHLASAVMNYIGYDAVVMGNHDVETGHAVFNRWMSDLSLPVLGANVVKDNGEPFLLPYRVFEKEGVKIAVVGMTTQAIPAWLPKNLWAGLRFDDIEETARRVLPLIREKESPDVVVGLFHSGVKPSEIAGFKESVGMEVAQRVPGFDVILCGHDHSLFNQKIVNAAGDSVLIIDPSSGVYHVSDVTLDISLRDGKVVAKTITGNLPDISEKEPDEAYLNRFAEAYAQTAGYVDSEIGEFTETISVHDAFIGPSAFVDLLHSLQLKLTGAEISLAAPLALHAAIDSGKVYMRDMFNLYKYENLLYTMTLTGKEIRGALEYSYGLWCRQMKSEDDHMLWIESNPYNGKYRFVHPFFSFDSAAGIVYTVDVSKPAGERINIAGMADGAPFDEDKVYRVAVNSYRGSGGGSILTEGSGIPREKLSERIVFSTDKDLRYYLAEEIKKEKVVSPVSLNQWRFIPEEWVRKAAKRDYELLFGEKAGRY